MKIFEYSDYKTYLNDVMGLNSHIRGYKTQLATAAGCQKSFFSHVHRMHVHLTPDHAAGLASFWQFDDVETDYFLTLVDLARAGTQKLQNQLQERLRKIKLQQAHIEGRIKNSELQENLIQTSYYSSWYWAALHIVASIPDFQTPKKMAERLGLGLDLVQDTLKELERMGLLKKSDGRWTLTDRSFHLKKDSPLNEMNHANWRHRALIDVQKKTEASFHYTSVFSLSKADAKKFYKMISELTLETRKLIEPSPEEELYCFNADFFVV